MRLDGYRMAAGVRAAPDAEHENCASELIEAVNLPSGPGDVLENRVGLGAVRIPHAAQSGNAKHSNDIAYADRSTIHIPDAGGLCG
jgi:hypothetical protein